VSLLLRYKLEFKVQILPGALNFFPSAFAPKAPKKSAPMAATTAALIDCCNVACCIHVTS